MFEGKPGQDLEIIFGYPLATPSLVNFQYLSFLKTYVCFSGPLKIVSTDAEEQSSGSLYTEFGDTVVGLAPEPSEPPFVFFPYNAWNPTRSGSSLLPAFGSILPGFLLCRPHAVRSTVGSLCKKAPSEPLGCRNAINRENARIRGPLLGKDLYLEKKVYNVFSVNGSDTFDAIDAL